MNQDLYSYFNINANQEIGLIFDVDELLFDNRKEIALAYRSLLDFRGIAVPDDERFPGKNLFDIIDRIKQVYGLNESIDDLVLERRNHYIKLLDQADSASVASGVKELFSFIEENRNQLNIRLGYASSSEKAFVDIILKKVFAYCGLPQYITNPDKFFYCNSKGDFACTCWEKGMDKKPSPRVYLETIEKIELLPNQCIAFEDSLSGMQAAIAAGLNVIVVPSTSQIDIFTSTNTQHVPSNRFLRLNSLRDFWPFFSSIISS